MWRGLKVWGALSLALCSHTAETRETSHEARTKHHAVVSGHVEEKFVGDTFVGDSSMGDTIIAGDGSMGNTFVGDSSAADREIADSIVADEAFFRSAQSAAMAGVRLEETAATLHGRHELQSRDGGLERDTLGGDGLGGATQFASFGSSVLAALSLTVVTEVGDRTFFVAALLAAQYSKWQVWLGAAAALWTQTILCSLAGSLVHRWQFKSAWMSWPLDDYLAGVMLIIFGILHIHEGLVSATEDSEGDKSASLEISPSSALLECPKTGDMKRRPSAASSKQIEQAREKINTNTLAKNQSSIILHAYWLVMVAEIGDRSMFSTIALAAAQNPWGVALGASLGHGLVTGCAVTCAALLSQFLNERIIAIFGGLLFVAFGLLSLTEGLVRQGVV
eukprot:Gregarina_sp_Pseudo_9__765@NODE_1490_length_1554_cov_41_232343_g1380_i0_p1_GENE_NODE_1490_length_1554_cov_41_232343_g1380_i0NODE_1490_length_1554_cov_41_232343_g1380_i0_p1_ORF_typecomplete_len392_score95_03UPF0016/PF01169_19/5_3e15UPF0016/PF01169_19/8_1e22TerC/PF03741_16/0_0016DUF2783/PF10932_8/49DUF2783/PF10932_8/1e04DUF2783/PF10932_8/7_1Mntp/PF02659_15/0_61Mntp/PF02659_15/1_2_NODE_1490_length_1554_cov_41_232343_g1380_i03581533